MLILGIAIIAGATVWCVWTLIEAAIASHDRRH